VLIVLETVRDYCLYVGMRKYAAQARVDTANLSRVLDGRPKPSLAITTKLEIELAQDSKSPHRHKNSSPGADRRIRSEHPRCDRTSLKWAYRLAAPLLQNWP
jgi:hypothetical protein